MSVLDTREEAPLRTGNTWNRRVIFAILGAYTAGFILTALSAGPWQASRDFAAEGLILFLWLGTAGFLLHGQGVSEVPVRRPSFELLIGLLTAGLLTIGAALYYLGQTPFLTLNLAIIYLVPLLILGLQIERRRAFGLYLPGRSAWLALLAIIMINIAGSILLGNLLPPGELPTPPGADLSQELTSFQRVLLMLGQVTLVAAIPEELFFRVFLQARLNRFMPAGWAILAQALLFSAAHLPQGLIHYGETWPIALAGLFSIANGLIGGYLWQRTRSLPLLVILHLFAYPRFGI